MSTTETDKVAEALRIKQEKEIRAHQEGVATRRMTTINAMADEIGEWAENKGFRDDWKNTVDGPHDFRNQVIGTKLMLIVSEASEALDTLRDHGAGKVVKDGNIIEELADIVIRVMDLNHMLSGDLGEAIVKKMQVNRDRAHKHGRNF